MALGPPIAGMPHPAMAGPASVVQAMWGNLTVLGLLKAFPIGLLQGLYGNVYWEDLGRAMPRNSQVPMGRLWP